MDPFLLAELSIRRRGPEADFGRLPSMDAIPTEEMGDRLPMGPALAMGAIFRCIGDFFLAIFGRKRRPHPDPGAPAAPPS